MLSVVLLFTFLAALLQVSFAHDGVWSKRFVVDARRSHGLVPRQEIHEGLLNLTSTGGTGIIPLTLASDLTTYYVTMSIGNISFRLALDTASSDLFVASTDCGTSTCRSVPRYPLAYQSPTFVSINNNATTFNVSFVDGTYSSGYVARELVTVANLTSTTQAFGVVNDSNVILVDQVSGIMGLGFPRLSQIYHTVANATPFFTSLAQQGLVSYPVFGVYLTRNNTGTLSLGAIDSAAMSSINSFEWHYVVPFSPVGTTNNVSSYLFWALELATISVNGSSITPQPTYPNATANASIAILDLGAPGIYGPYQDVSRIFSKIQGGRLVDPSGQWAIPCDARDTMSFSFGGHGFVLQPTDYLIGPVQGDSVLCLAWPKASPPSSDGIDWQLGSAFLRTVYTVFSYGINTKEPPIVGLYPLSNVTALEDYGVVSAFLSSESVTVATTLPNYLLATPSYTTPPYSFNTSVPWQPGETVSSELATSTYSPLLASGASNLATAPPIPLVSLSPSVVTFLVTESGTVVTQTSTAVGPSNTLGIPYGWTGAGHRPDVPTVFILFVLSTSFILTAFRLLL